MSRRRRAPRQPVTRIYVSVQPALPPCPAPRAVSRLGFDEVSERRWPTDPFVLRTSEVTEQALLALPALFFELGAVHVEVAKISRVLIRADQGQAQTVAIIPLPEKKKTGPRAVAPAADASAEKEQKQSK